MKVAIYARYSTDQQDRTSIDGQRRNCEQIAAANGWKVIKVYADEAISGTDDNRPQYQALLVDSEARKFDGIIVDETSRLTRRAGELPRLLEILAFRGQVLVDCKGFDSRQETAGLLASIYGGIDSLELRKIKERTHRGLRERARAGYSAGGKTYGYDSVPIDADDPQTKKRLVIVEAESEIVREIFWRFADGESAKRICDDLNRRRVPSPGSSWSRRTRRSKGWMASALVGTAAQFTGILRRELYIGLQVWNRRKFKRVPGTSRRIVEVRPPSEWETIEHPGLRIVDQAVWDRVQARLAASRERTHPKNKRPRGRPSRYLLSGLMKCGSCGASFIMTDSRRYGCSSHSNGGKHLCGNNLHVVRAVAEGALLMNLKERLLQPDVIAYVEEQFRQAVRDMERQSRTEASAVERVRDEITEIDAKIEKILAAIESVGISPALTGRLKSLEADKEAAQSALHELQHARPQVVALPNVVPRLVKRWHELVEQIEEIAEAPAARSADVQAARSHLRALLGEITLMPRDGVLWAHPAPNAKGLAETSPFTSPHINQRILVAGAGFEPATFGL